MKLIIILALALTLSANEACETAKIDYDRNNALSNKGINQLDSCNLMVENLKIIIRECDYRPRTKQIVGHIIETQIKQCESIVK